MDYHLMINDNYIFEWKKNLEMMLGIGLLEYLLIDDFLKLNNPFPNPFLKFSANYNPILCSESVYLSFDREHSEIYLTYQTACKTFFNEFRKLYPKYDMELTNEIDLDGMMNGPYKMKNLNISNDISYTSLFMYDLYSSFKNKYQSYMNQDNDIILLLDLCMDDWSNTNTIHFIMELFRYSIYLNIPRSRRIENPIFIEQIDTCYSILTHQIKNFKIDKQSLIRLFLHKKLGAS
jgi:hypothetical protein